MNPKTSLSIIIPAKKESIGLQKLLPVLLEQYSYAEIIVVNDGSTDDTQEICQKAYIITVSHRHSMGNGAATKIGARLAKRAIIVFMDANGQHYPEVIPSLLEKLNNGYNMVMGARIYDTHASITRLISNHFYSRLALFWTGYRIEDLTSGFRAVRARHFRKFQYLLPNSFSFPTTYNMAFFQSCLPVTYVPIRAGQREGKSNIKLIKDGLLFFIIITNISSLFSPTRSFLPISISLFTLGLGYYGYTHTTADQLTNMSALLFFSFVFTFLIGIISEQISAIHYKMCRRRITSHST